MINNSKMRDELLNNLDNPKQLEKLYRDNKVNFKKEFNQIYPEHQQNSNLSFWHERLNFEIEKQNLLAKNEIIIVIAFSFIAGLIEYLFYVEAKISIQAVAISFIGYSNGSYLY